MNASELNGFARADRVVASETKTEEIAIIFYENEVPPFVGSELESLYENIYSSIAHWRISGAIQDASTFALRENGKLVTVLLFRREQDKVSVINEGIPINNAEVDRFAGYIFGTFKDVNVISFQAIQTDVERLPFPYQRVNFLEDIVVSLPSTEQDYLASLGRSTRQNLNNRRKRLERAFPSFSYQVFERGEIAEKDVCAILKLSMARVAQKNRGDAMDEKATQRLILLARSHGIVLVAKIDGRICGGTICLSVGANYFMRITAYDPVYESYRLGMLFCYLTICACIARGGREAHLLWGRSQYKYSLMGVERDLDNLVLYRNYFQLLRNSSSALKIAAQGHMRQLKLWVLRHQEDRSGARVAMAAVRLLRGVGRSVGRVQ